MSSSSIRITRRAVHHAATHAAVTGAPDYAHTNIITDVVRDAHYAMPVASWGHMIRISEWAHAALMEEAWAVVQRGDDALAALAVPPHVRALFRHVQPPPAVGTGIAAAPLIGRMDWAIDQYDVATGTGVPRLLEYNADTYGLLCDTAVTLPALARSGQFGMGWAHTGASLTTSIQRAFRRRLARGGGGGGGTGTLALLHHPGDRVIQETADTLQYVCGLAGLKVTRWEYPSTPADADMVDVVAVMKLFRWMGVLGTDGTPATSMFPPILSFLQRWCMPTSLGGDVPRLPVNEPLISYLLQHKGLLALLWQRYPDHPNLIPTILADPTHAAGRVDLEGEWIWKAFHGLRSKDVVVVSKEGVVGGGASGLVSHEQQVAANPATFLAQRPGGVMQPFLRLRPVGDGQVPILSTWMVEGRCVAAVIREDTHIITRDDETQVAGVAALLMGPRAVAQ